MAEKPETTDQLQEVARRGFLGKPLTNAQHAAMVEREEDRRKVHAEFLKRLQTSFGE